MPSDAKDRVLLGYSLLCALGTIAAACIFRAQAGTNHLPIHVAAILLGLGFYAVARRAGVDDPLGVLGLRRPGRWRWTWILLLLGVASGALRLAFYRHTGHGGLALYDREFAPLLAGDSWPELAARHALFLAVLYLAVLIPGVLFCGTIQGPLSRAGWLGAGLSLQALAFGFVHCTMAGPFSLVYGLEALAGAVVYGVAFEWLGNLYVPAVFLAASVFTSTVLLRVVPA